MKKMRLTMTSIMFVFLVLAIFLALLRVVKLLEGLADEIER